VKLLVRYGADVMAEDDLRHTPLEDAIWDNRLETASALIDSSLKSSEASGRAPLSIAACCLMKEMVHMLLERGADINARHEIIGPPIIAVIAATDDYHEKESLEMITYLLGHGAFINGTDVSGKAALHHAAENGCLLKVRYLVEHGADIRSRDNEGHTPLSLAINLKNTEIADLLRQLGAKE